MNVGSVSRSSALDTTQPVAPPVSPDAAPIDLGRDVAEHGPSVTTRSAGTQAALATPSVARPFVDPQIQRAADAFARDGMPGLDDFLRSHPADARWMLSISRQHLAEGMRTALSQSYGGGMGPMRAFIDAERIDAHLCSDFQGSIREAVRRTAVGRLDAMTHALESMPLDRTLEALRDAPAGSQLAALRDALHLTGGAMDRERVEGWVRTSLHELHALRDTVMGQTWMPEEFPGSMAQVQHQMGLERATPGSIAGEALFRGHHGAADRAHAHETAVDSTIVAAEGTHVALEGAELVAHGGIAGLAADATVVAAGGGLAVGLAGLAFGYELHHQIQENRAERTEAAAALGL